MRRTILLAAALIGLSAASRFASRAPAAKIAPKKTAAKPGAQARPAPGSEPAKSQAHGAAAQALIAPSVIEAIESLSAKDPQVALRVYYIAAEGCQAQNQPGKAQEIFEAAAQRFPQNEDLLNRLLSIYRQLGKNDELLAAAGRLAKLHPENANYTQMVANARFSKGDVAGGLAAWADALSSHADDPNLQLLYAQTLQSHGKGPEAIEHYEAAAKLRPEDLGIQQQLAQSYLSNQKLDEAKKAYEHILASFKETGAQHEAVRQLLSIAKAQKTLDKTLADLEDRASKNPSNESVQWQLIEGYTLANSTQQLLATLERAAKLAPEDQELRMRLISFYQAQSQWDKAIELRKADAEKNPADGRLRVLLGQAYLNARKLDEALAAFKEAAKTDPSNMAFAERLAEAHVASKQFDEAIKQYEEMLGKASEEWRNKAYQARIDQLSKLKEQAGH